MIGVALIVIAMVLVVPVGIMLAGAVWSALMGAVLVDDADRRNPLSGQ